MMLFKLSLRNIRKSMHDYVIYFVTLVIGVAIFYVFNSMDQQTVMLNVSQSTYDVIDLMLQVMSGISVVVSFILGFLIVYASNFLLKRRKKEFAIYMLLGMGKRKISMIIVFETVLIGLISLVAGLALGAFASQGMSLVVAGMFEADMTEFAFILSWKAIVKTILYFCILYAIVVILDAIVVGKAKLATLLYAKNKTEKNIAKNPVVCVIVFAAACVLLGTAYYMVTAGASEITSESALLMQIVKGIIGTFLVFWSLAGILVFTFGRWKGFTHHGINVFTLKEVSSRINTTVFSGSIICLMLFVTICVLSSAMSIRKSVNDNLKDMVPVDINFKKTAGEKNDKSRLTDVFKEINLDTTMFRDEITFQSYKIKKFSTLKYLADYFKHEGINVAGSDLGYFGDLDMEIVRLSDYNSVAKLYGKDSYELSENEYILCCDFASILELFNGALSVGTELEFDGKTLHPKSKECYDGFIEMSSSHSNFGFIIVPDEVDITKLSIYADYYIANYAASSADERKKTETYMDSEEFRNLINPKDDERQKNGESQWHYVAVSTKTDIYAASIGITAMIIFIGIYLGLIFMIASAAILALKELSEASDNREKYQILRRIGVEEHLLRRSVFSQCAIFFGMPLVIAIIHSIFGIQVAQYIFESFGQSGLLYSILTTTGMVIAVYGVYFIITFLTCKKIISE